VLVVAQRGRFPRGAARHDAVGSIADVELDELAELVLVNGAVPEWRDQRDDGAVESGAHERALHESMRFASEDTSTLAPPAELLQAASRVRYHPAHGIDGLASPGTAVPLHRAGGGGPRAVRDSLLRLRSPHAGGHRAHCAGVPGAVRLHAALR